MQAYPINPAIPPLPPNAADHHAAWLIAAVLLFPLVLLSVLRRAQALRFNLYYLCVGGIVGIIAFSIGQLGATDLRTSSVAIGVLAFLLIYAMRPARNRRIPSSLRRMKIAEWEHKTGKRYSSRKYELDHVVPFSKGGGHTIGNLRVIEKEKNRSKGARGPWWDILGFWQ